MNLGRVLRSTFFLILENLAEAIAWLQIAISPILVSVVIGGLVFLGVDSTLGIVLAIGIVLIGIVLGIMWAEHARKKTGTTNYMGVLLRTPELYREKEEENTDATESEKLK